MDSSQKYVNRKIYLVIFTIFGIIFLTLGYNYVTQHNYQSANIFPTNDETKTKAFWNSLDRSKLEKLVQKNQIESFAINNINSVSFSNSDEYSITIIFNVNGGSTVLPEIRVYPVSEIAGNYLIIFNTNGTSVENMYNPNNLSRSEVDDISEKSLKIYNQFIDDYKSLGD